MEILSPNSVNIDHVLGNEVWENKIKPCGALQPYVAVVGCAAEAHALVNNFHVIG